MRIETKTSGNVTIIEFSGNITDQSDYDSLRDIVRALVSQGKTNAVADLSRVGIMNSLGLGVLTGSLVTLRNKGGDLKIAAITDRIKSILVVTRLITIFDNYDSVDEAVRSYGK